MTENGIGAAARRKEDQRFITGKGQYTDDINRPHQLQAHIIRSPLPHARIKSIDAAAALAMPGVVAMFTGKDMADDGVGSLPDGCHICEVEIDPDTGVVTVDRFTAADDFGRIINPMIVEGQVHGGVTQGIGQALYEQCIYDESGQLLTGSYMDYCLPKADKLPNFQVTTNTTLCVHNALGVKGCGEAGTIGSTPAVINAVVDALSDIGVTDMPIPATPERVWQAIRAASA